MGKPAKLVQTGRSLEFGHDVDSEMVAEIATDTRKRVFDFNVVGAQFVRRSDARQHHELRRSDRAGGHDHLPVRARLFRFATAKILHSGCASGLNLNRTDKTLCRDRQVCSAKRRFQIADRCRASALVSDSCLVNAGAMLNGTVKVRAVGNAKLLTGANECQRHRLRVGNIGHAQRTGCAVVLIRKYLVAFSADEELPDVVKRPARTSLFVAPPVIVDRISACEHQCIDRRPAANDLGLRIRNFPTVGVNLRSRLESPSQWPGASS